MKQIITVLIFLFSLMIYSQAEGKPEYFYFDNQKISKELFKKLDERKVYFKEIENDTAVIKNAYSHKIIGKLDSIQHSQINMFFQKIIGDDFRVNKKTMIHLYNNNDSIYKGSRFKKYWKWIDKNSDEYQAFLIGTKNSPIKEDKRKHIYVDSYNLLENLFFKNSDFKINHLLIKPNGEVYIYYGLTNILQVLDWSVD